MPYCLQCGAPASERIPDGDSKLRLVCDRCDYIHYENPKVICGALVLHDDKILMCRRAIEPRYGLWTLPAGFMEIGETMMEGALRETIEEAAAIATHAKLYCLFDIPQLGQVHAMYLANLADGKFGAGVESLECALVAEADIPWQDLAFRTISMTLENYLADKKSLQAQGKDATDFTLYPLHEIRLDEYR
ncbi:NUDIX hydrolase [Moraxella caviae]|uniref:Bifunctional nicotinamide mononucleotide adenylyltransferase/ADP-ribose pyrophosphatase n=1 Tax=Moraxella caviae TaxID=34060 RepID=A0A1T0A1R1_9GAMM|nr:NUDIX hydrolase [Moraxella caviae]OOR89644.1 NUDIX hydrolase [Moraxella caviae]STZ10333.1 bifunctional nicotinamide mononucleotide adenylyltransferase/ADP-ribose pyrophosphatase [Moraxella caviae]VEW10437.1 bifunctional nicotinamide mononucleotide adenylyltransferase/ADP-ribose pyrophosphatase [Moraxella caviae]